MLSLKKWDIHAFQLPQFILTFSRKHVIERKADQSSVNILSQWEKNRSFFHLFNYMKELCERLYFSTRYPCGWMLSPETLFLEKCWHLESVKGDCRESWWKQALVIFSSNYTELQSSQQLCLLPFLGKAKLNGLRRTLISLCLFLSEKWGPNLFSVYFFLSAYLISTLEPNFFDHINILKISVSVTWWLRSAHDRWRSLCSSIIL